MKSLALTKRIFDKHEFDFFVEVIIESARSVIVLVGAFYERNDPAEAERARAWYDEALAAYFENGYPPYRATTMSMTHAMDTNIAARDFLAKVKLAVDPANLIAPGRYGTPQR
jgi:4-cresol dehydrogenase (hydroxylating)